RPTWSPDSTRIAFDANEPDRYGDRHLYVATINGDPSHATVTPLSSGRGTDIAPVWSPDGKRLVFQHTDPQNSADLYVIDVDRVAKEAAASSGSSGSTDGRSAALSAPRPQRVRLTDSMPSSIDKSQLVEPEMVRYAGPDGQQVPAWLLVPRNLDRSKRHPAI